MQAQANREERVRAVAATMTRHELNGRQMLGGRLPHDMARALAELIVDAIVAVDNRESQRRRGITG